MHSGGRWVWGNGRGATDVTGVTDVTADETPLLARSVRGIEVSIRLHRFTSFHSVSSVTSG